MYGSERSTPKASKLSSEVTGVVLNICFPYFIMLHFLKPIGPHTIYTSDWFAGPNLIAFAEQQVRELLDGRKDDPRMARCWLVAMVLLQEFPIACVVR